MTRHLSVRTAIVLSAVLSAAVLGKAQAPQAPAAGGGRGGNDATVAALWTAFDADKDGSVTRAEMKGAFAKWYDATDTAKSGSVTTDQLGPALNTALALPAPAPAQPGGGGRAAGAPGAPAAPACGGRGNLPTVGQTPVPGRRDQNDGGAARNRAGQAGKGTQDPRVRERARLRAWVDSSRRENDRGTREEDGRVDDHGYIRPCRHQYQEPRAVRCALPLEHDRVLPRCEDNRTASEQGGGRGAAGRPSRFRARRQGPWRHSRDRRFLSQPLRQRSGLRCGAWRWRSRRRPERCRRHPGVGPPPLVLGCQ